MVRDYRFPALQVHQGDGAPPLILLSASAAQLEQFAGVPQKRRLQEGETIGFQRDADETRISALAKFYSDPKNVIHNPLLCAIRAVAQSAVAFTPEEGAEADAPSVSGELQISFPDYAQTPLAELFRLARETLEERVPELRGREDPRELIAKLAASVNLVNVDTGSEDEDEAEDEEGANSEQIDSGSDDNAGEEALFEESHVSEFWAALRAREILLGKFGAQYQDEQFLGFGRDALESYLLPVVLVDGQHRLLGAMRAARDSLNTTPESLDALGERLRAGADAGQLEEALLIERARRLPISLLMDPRPEEHVFQFVVVNQKATPVRPALLATIISTSLSEDELAPISERLENAGIPLRSSRAITFLARNATSPFAGLVARGLSDEGSELLPWTVLGQLVAIFRDLKGGRFFHDRKQDYADIWKRRFLENSPIVERESDAETSAFEIWREPEGPWRDVFIAFWCAVRDVLGNTSNPEAANYWGRPRTSNLFNKPSLMTLAVDFFAYLVENRKTIEDASVVSSLVMDWLLDVDRNYFARDWKLAGVKKDAPGTRKQWAKLWQSYRIDPRALPAVRLYSTLYKEG